MGVIEDGEAVIPGFKLTYAFTYKNKCGVLNSVGLQCLPGLQQDFEICWRGSFLLGRQVLSVDFENPLAFG